jgi:hypothetical protein
LPIEVSSRAPIPLRADWRHGEAVKTTAAAIIAQMYVIIQPDIQKVYIGYRVETVVTGENAINPSISMS